MIQQWFSNINIFQNHLKLLLDVSPIFIPLGLKRSLEFYIPNNQLTPYQEKHWVKRKANKLMANTPEV